MNRGKGNPESGHGYGVAAAAFCVQMMAVGVLTTFGVFFTPLVNEFNWSRVTVSAAASMGNFMSGALAIVAGASSDRYGPRVVMTVAGVLVASSYFLMSQLQAVWQLYLFYGLLFGIGWSASDVVPLSTVAKRFKAKVGVITGIVKVGAGTGMFGMPLLVGNLISSLGWRISYIIMGAIFLVVVSVAAQFLRTGPSPASSENSDPAMLPAPNTVLAASGLSLRQAFRTRQLWIVCALYLFVFWCVQTVLVHIAPHAIDLGLSMVAAASMVSVIGVASMAGRFATGAMIDRFGMKRSATICIIMWAMAFLWLQLEGGTWMLYLFAVVYGFNHGGLLTIVSPKVAELFGTRSHGSIFGVVMMASAIGGAIGPTLAGRLFEVTGSYNSAFLILAVLAVLMLILNTILRPVSVKEPE